MSVVTTVSISMTLAGQSFPESQTITADGAEIQNVSHPAALTGTITSGVITLSDTGDIANTDRVDVYWADGTRLGCTAASLSADVSVDVSADGVGDALPTGGTVVQFSEPTEMTITLTGDDLQSILFYAQTRGGIAVVDDGDVEAFQQNLATGGTYLWWNGNGDVNPVAGDTIAKVFVSHNGTAAASIRVGFSYNNS